VTAVNGTSNYGSMALTSGSAGMYTLTVPTTDAGTVVFSAEVTDSVTGLMASSNLSVEVAANAAPVAVVTFTPSAVISGNSVVANIALTDDKSTFANITSTVTLDGATMGASSDGVSALTGSVTTSAVAGTTYTVVVTATDEHGFVSTTTATVTASEAPVSGGVVSTGDSLVDSIFVDVTPGISQSAGDTIVTSLGASVTKDVALNSSIKNFNSTVSASNPTQSFTSDLIKTEVVLSTDVTAVVTNTGASGNAVKMSGVPVGYTATLATIDKSKYSSVPAGAVGDVISVALMNGSSIVNSGVSLSFTLTGLADSTKTQTLSQLQDDGSWVVRDDITLTASGSDLIATVTGLATTASSKGRQAASTSEASSFVVANDVSSSATAPATSGGGGGGGCLLR
jgi:hypothetical protein